MPIAIECVIFGTPAGFSCSNLKYKDLLFQYYLKNTTGVRFFIETFEDKCLLTYVNYNFLSSGSRSDSHFGISLIIDGVIPIRYEDFYEYLQSVFSAISNKKEYFKLSSKKTYQFTSETLMSPAAANDVKEIEATVRNNASVFFDDYLISTFKNRNEKKPVVTLNFNENILIILKNLGDGKIVTLSNTIETSFEKNISTHTKKNQDSQNEQLLQLQNENKTLKGALYDIFSEHAALNTSCQSTLADLGVLDVVPASRSIGKPMKTNHSIDSENQPETTDPESFFVKSNADKARANARDKSDNQFKKYDLIFFTLFSLVIAFILYILFYKLI